MFNRIYLQLLIKNGSTLKYNYLNYSYLLCYMKV